MCLLESVSHWSDAVIQCRTQSHMNVDNPLRNAHGLPISAGIEYAAQAMAVHGALLAQDDQPAQVGYLTSVRNVQWWTTRLDALGSEILIQANRISGNDLSLLYDFSIECQDRLVMRGRAGVLVRPPAVP